jgi:peptidoglycan hydrolase-like protein with peptidoglycan-binding domain
MTALAPHLSPYVPSVVSAKWGQLHLFIGGVDVTNFRGIAVQLYSFGSSEPFGDDQAVFYFNQITPFDSIGQPGTDTAWLYDWAPVELTLVRPDGGQVVLWQGNVSTDECQDGQDPSTAGTAWTTISCMGALQLLKLRMHPPQFTRQVVDIGQWIPQLVNQQITDYGLPLSQMASQQTGIQTRQSGSWTDLQSFIQDLLSTATVDIVPALGAPTVGGGSRPDGLGYWTLSGLEPEQLVKENYTQGLGTTVLSVIVDQPAVPDGTISGYGWMTPYFGSMVNEVENGIPVSLMCRPQGDGYWIVSSDGGVFTYGAASFYGSAGGSGSYTDFIDGSVAPNGEGYWLVRQTGGVYSYGAVAYHGGVGSCTQATALLDVGGSHYFTFVINGQTFVYYNGTGSGTVVFGASGVLDSDGNAVSPIQMNVSRIDPTGLILTMTASPIAAGVGDGAAVSNNDDTIIVPDGTLVTATSDTTVTISNAILVTTETPATTVAGLNTAFGSSNMPLVASVSGGSVQVVSTTYGSTVSFTVAVDTGSPATYTGSGVPATAICSTKTGSGYWVLPADGVVHPFGDAVHYGNAGSPEDNPAVDMEISFGGEGYWVVNAYGQVSNFGDALYHGGGVVGGATSIARIFAPPPGVLDGYWLLGQDGNVYQKGAVPYCGSTTGEDGNWYQWTIRLGTNRTPIMLLKNIWSVNWTLFTGAPGVELDLTRSLQNFPNVFYGEGIDVAGCHWRNTKYPGQVILNPPVWTREITAGMSGPDVKDYQNQLIATGYAINNPATGTYDAVTAAVTLKIQGAAGLSTTGTVTAQTWVQVFDIGNTGAGVTPFFEPLAENNSVEPFLYNANGEHIGPNPTYNPKKMRNETYYLYAANTDKSVGIQDARSQLSHYNAPGYSGTITLNTDPVEGSRFEIVAGTNIMLRNFRGRDPLLHVVQVSHSITESGSFQSTITVDEQAHDLVTLGAIINRDLQTNDPTRRQGPTRRASRITEDRKSQWDCENNCGVVPLNGIQAGMWNVIRIPVGDSGSIVATTFAMTIPTIFSIAIFDTAVTPEYLASAIPGGPFSSTNPAAVLGVSCWDLIPEASGLIVAWGDALTPAGFYPNNFGDDGAAITGVMGDFSTLYYETSDPPWIYVTLYSPINNTCQGSLAPAMTGY